MSKVGEREVRTQQRVVDFFREAVAVAAYAFAMVVKAFGVDDEFAKCEDVLGLAVAFGADHFDLWDIGDEPCHLLGPFRGFRLGRVGGADGDESVADLLDLPSELGRSDRVFSYDGRNASHINQIGAQIDWTLI